MIEFESQLVRLLMRAGYLAAWNGFPKEALTIFHGVQTARPQSEVPVIGAAVVAMLTGHPEVAVSTLQDGALALNPDSDLARAHLGCALRMQGREEEGLSLLQTIASTTREPDAQQMAQNLLSLSHVALPPQSPLP